MARLAIYLPLSACLLFTHPGEGARASSSKQPLAEALRALGDQGPLVEANPQLQQSYKDFIATTQLKASRGRTLQLQTSEAFHLRMRQAENHILASLYEEQWLSSRMTPQLLRQYYESQRTLFARREVQYQQIIVRERELAASLLAELKGHPERFSALESKHSRVRSQASVGPLAWYRKGMQGVAIESLVFTAPLGTIAPQLVASESGYHIIKVVAVRQVEQDTYEGLAGDVKAFRERELKIMLAEDLNLALLGGGGSESGQ